MSMIPVWRDADPGRRARLFRQAFREALERRGLVDGVAWRARPHHPLEDWQRLINSWSSSIRCGVERAHATMKQWYGMSRVRYRGLARDACHLQFVATAMNMKRALVLMEQNRRIYFRPTRRAFSEPIEQARRPPDACILVSNPSFGPTKAVKTSKNPNYGKLSCISLRSPNRTARRAAFGRWR
jgi:hypothetical protein